MKKRTQTGLKKTASKTEAPQEVTKKSQGKKRIQKLTQNLQTDSDKDDRMTHEAFEALNPRQNIQKSKSHLQDNHIDCSMAQSEEIFMDYDAEMMQEIEKEIYEAQNYQTISPIQKLREIETEYTNDEEIHEGLKSNDIGIVIKEGRKKMNRAENKINSSKSFENARNLNISTQTEKIQSESQEQSIFVTQKLLQKTIQFQPQFSIKKSNHEQKMKPKKQLKTSQTLNKKFLNFSINLKLLKGNLQVRRIVKCLESKKINQKWTAEFLIETQNGEQTVANNEEMIYFYKDFLIDYYQGIHFS